MQVPLGALSPPPRLERSLKLDPIDQLAFDPRVVAAQGPDALRLAATRAIDHLAEIPTRRVGPDPEAVTALAGLGGQLAGEGERATDVIDLLDRIGRPATVLSTSPRFFGFVAGGTLPVTLAAQWIAAAWDQNANMRVLSPLGCFLEDVAGAWLIDLLKLPHGTHCSFVTGTTTADITALLGARHALLGRYGWDVAKLGMAGSPPIRAVVGEQVHTTMLRALRVIGIGEHQIVRVPADNQGRMIIDRLPRFDRGPAILCVQAGNVDSGAFDPLRPLCERAHEAGAWVHVDGAFGLWAAACPELADLIDGHELADSWACDAHKWLNVPYDSGLAFTRDRESLRESLKLRADYLIQDLADPMEFTLEASRRARGIEVWAALRNLGRHGMADLIRGSCALARRFATRMLSAGFEVLNEVVLNQVLVSFGSDERTAEVIRRAREDGTAWFSGTRWRDRGVMRVSVSCWATTEDDIDVSAEAVVGIARNIPA
jgi:glutamate/tyrosine decarboxylase-like PLP-dependent enzyme